MTLKTWKLKSIEHSHLDAKNANLESTLTVPKYSFGSFSNFKKLQFKFSKNFFFEKA